jgi:ADP-heptose:LPS heptosyltransferase
MDQKSEILVIHPGGLGDACLSESTFLSLRHHFGDRLRAVGNRRVLAQFSEYFVQIDSIDSRSWMPLFTDCAHDRRWQTIVLIGKDRSSGLRQRLQGLAENVVFVETYPDRERIHVEEYQLRQLPHWAIKPLRKECQPRIGNRLILYAEGACQKAKWPPARFLELYEALKEAGAPVCTIRARELSLRGFDVALPDDLGEVADFFGSGGLFFSNDSGMAHFAARCGLYPLTIFSDTDPVVWHPRTGLVLTSEKGSPTVPEVLDFILSAIEKLGFPRV